MNNDIPDIYSGNENVFNPVCSTGNGILPLSGAIGDYYAILNIGSDEVTLGDPWGPLRGMGELWHRARTSMMIVTSKVSAYQAFKLDSENRKVYDILVQKGWVPPLALEKRYHEICNLTKCRPGLRPPSTKDPSHDWNISDAWVKQVTGSLERLLPSFFSSACIKLPFEDIQGWFIFGGLFMIPGAVSISDVEAKSLGAKLLFCDCHQRKGGPSLCITAQVLIDAWKAFGTVYNPISQLIKEGLSIHSSRSPLKHRDWNLTLSAIRLVESSWNATNPFGSIANILLKCSKEGGKVIRFSRRFSKWTKNPSLDTNLILLEMMKTRWDLIHQEMDEAKKWMETHFPLKHKGIHNCTSIH